MAQTWAMQHNVEMNSRNKLNGSWRWIATADELGPKIYCGLGCIVARARLQLEIDYRWRTVVPRNELRPEIDDTR